MARLTVQNPAQHKFNIKNFLFFLRVLYIQKKTANIKIQQLKYMNNSFNKTLQVSFVSRLLFSARILLLTAVGRVVNPREQPATWRTMPPQTNLLFICLLLNCSLKTITFNVYFANNSVQVKLLSRMAALCYVGHRTDLPPAFLLGDKINIA